MGMLIDAPPENKIIAFWRKDYINTLQFQFALLDENAY